MLTSGPFGFVFGLIAVACWTGYSIAGKAALQAGFRPDELAALRYVVPAIALLPFAFGDRLQRLLRVGLARIVLLALLIGPLYGFGVMYGLTLAPLSHAAVLGPAGVLLTSQLLHVMQRKELPSRAILIGMVLVLAGVILVAQPSTAQGTSPNVVLGDLIFFATGVAFAVFGKLSYHWRLKPLDALTGVSLVSALALAPFAGHLFGDALITHDVLTYLFQVFMQGLVGGLFALLAYVAATSILGPSKASFFPAFVPVMTVMASAALGVEWPNSAIVLGVVLATAGLVFAQKG
jgi:drug/metabolite transporter (DMT)-like permease